MREFVEITFYGVIIGLFFILKSYYNPKIKWSWKSNRYCIVYETTKHIEEVGDEDRYEFLLVKINLPKFLNIFHRK